MDFVRGCWRRLFGDRRLPLLDFRPIDSRLPMVTAAVGSILLPELIRMITAYAADFTYNWNPTTIVPITIRGNELISRSDPSARPLRRIQASEPVRTGFNDRWRIIADFEPTSDGDVAVGMSKSSTAILHDRLSQDDVLVWTTASVEGPVWTFRNRDWIRQDCRRWIANRQIASQQVILVESDIPNRTITVTYRDGIGTIQSTVVPLSSDDYRDWRPAVVVRSSVRVRIVSWPAEYD